MCADACPVHAIDPSYGLNSSLCLRTYMENAPMPEMVMENIPGLLGCELCQYACPRNRPIGFRQPTEAESAALDIASILRGSTAPARDLIGKNMSGVGRLLAQAAALTGKNKRTDLIEEVNALVDHPKQAVRSAAQWAVRKLTGI
jgi:epoxyqueuosine reductase QueG